MAKAIGEYRLQRLSRSSRKFPKGEWAVVFPSNEIDPRTGKPKRRRLGLEVSLTRPESEAYAVMAEFVRARKAAQFGTSDLTIGQIYDLYMEDRRIAGMRLKGQKDWWRALAQTFKHFKPETLSETVIVAGDKRTHCHAYALMREQHGCSRATIHTELGFLRTLVKWAHSRRLRKGEPPYIWVPKRGEPRDIVLTEAEVFLLLDACISPHVRLFTILAMCTAARKSAILELRWDQIDFENGVIRLDRREKRSILDSSHRKGRATIPLNNLARAALSEAREIARTEYVIEYNSKPVGDIKKAFRRVVERAGLKDRQVTPHVLRHSVASWLLGKDIPMEKIQRMLGHRSMKTTEEVYAKADHNYLRDAVDAVNLRLVREQK